MLIFGLLLLLLAAAVITYMIVATNGMADVPLDYGILNLDMPPLWLYLSGAATVAVAAIGLWMMAAGARSKARKTREVRELRKQAKDQERRAERSDDATLSRPGRTTAPPVGTNRPVETTRPVDTTRSGYATGPERPGTVPGPATPPPGSTTDRSRLDLDR